MSIERTVLLVNMNYYMIKRPFFLVLLFRGGGIVLQVFSDACIIVGELFLANFRKYYLS